ESLDVPCISPLAAGRRTCRPITHTTNGAGRDRHTAVGASGAGDRRRPPVDAGGRVGVGLVERLALEEGLGQRVELVAVVAQQLAHLVLLLLDDPPGLAVDQL